MKKKLNLLKKVDDSVTNNLIKLNFIKNENYTNLLEIIGCSPKPLSSYEINKEFTRLYNNTEDIEINDKIKGKVKLRKKHNQYIYKMLNNLRPNLIENFYTYFFNWNKIENDDSEKKRIINYIKDNFKIDLQLSSNSFEGPNALPSFSKSKDDKIIKIENQSNHIMVLIEKTKYNNAELILKENNKTKILSSLKFRNNTEVYIPTIGFGEPFSTFMTMIYRKRPFFLDAKYDTRINKRSKR